MPPSVTVRPAAAHDERMCQSFRSWAGVDDTQEPRRRACAEQQAFVELKLGGLGYEPNARMAKARYAGTVIGRWEAVRALSPTLADERLSSSELPMICEARAALAELRETHAAVTEQRAAILAQGPYFDLFGTKHTPFVPQGLPASIPSADELDDETIRQAGGRHAVDALRREHRVRHHAPAR